MAMRRNATPSRATATPGRAMRRNATQRQCNESQRKGNARLRNGTAPPRSAQLRNGKEYEMNILTKEHAAARQWGRLYCSRPGNSGEPPAGLEARVLALSHFDEHGEMVPDPKEEIER